MSTLKSILSAGGLSLLALTGTLHTEAAQAAGDAKVGARVYAENCAECHSTKEGKNKKGPSLFQSFGRKAGAVGDFAYSDALKASGKSWTEAELDAYLTLPKKAIPGGKMKFDGKLSPQEHADLLAFLATLH